MRLLLIVTLVLFVTGCAGVESTFQADVQKVQALAVPDLQAALADAQAHQDTAAVNCYTTLLTIIQSSPVTLPTIKGAVSAFQVGRDALSGTGANTLAKQINIGCASLFVDASLTLAKIAGMAGVGVPPLP